MDVPLYEDLQAYIRNSAVFNVHNVKTPLLLEVGDNDGTVRAGITSGPALHRPRCGAEEAVRSQGIVGIADC